MFRYVPEFILDRYSKDLYQGFLTAYILLLDVADFTSIGTALQKEGNRGAEELSRFLDVAFGVPIDIIGNYGGFVSLFAGDAVCALFPEATPESIVSTVNSICEYFKDKTEYKTPFGAFPFKLRQTIGYGDIHWQIFINELQSEYVFYGDAMIELAELTICKEDVIYSDSAARSIGIKLFEKQQVGFRLFSSNITAKHNPLKFHCTPELKDKFISPRFNAINPQNEIRNAAYCFANLEGIELDDRGKAINIIQSLSDKYGGFVNKYDATDKGLIAIIIFGLPKSEGKTLERICNFSLEAVESNPELALGISCGSVFAGFTGSGEVKEYTALGQPLNLAARLMCKAVKGEVLTDTYLWQELNTQYDFNYLGSLNLKGFALPIRYYSLSRQSKDVAWHQESRFVGRDEEIVVIRTLVNSCTENTVIYISGDAGIGKSRLTKEALTNYSSSTHHKFYVSCDAILTKPLEAVKQIVRSVFYYNPQLPEEAGIAMFRALWIPIAAGDADMQRRESVIASLLGYEWAQSFWSTIPPQEKPNHLRIAFIRLMEQLAKTKPVIIHLDDGQWLDQDSKSYFQALSDKWVHPVIIVTPCRYLDSGERVDLSLDGYTRIDIELNSLSYIGSIELIKTILRLENVPEATQQLIFTRSMGNPLFIEQLTSYLMESGFISEKGIVTGEVGYLSSFSISDIISSRIDRLTEQVRECMFNASVLGIEFNVKVLTQMLKVDPVFELEAGVKNRIWNDLDELRYIFSHILIKDVVYQRMISDKLQRLHQTAAEAMEIVYVDSLDENAEEIATHFEKGNLLIKAAEYYDRAGGYYWHTFILARSELNFQKSIANWELTLGKQSTEYAESLFHLGLLYHYMRDFTKVESFYKQVLEINENHHGKDSPLLSPYINNLGRFYKDIGLYSDSEILLRRSLQIEMTTSPNSSNVADRLNNLGHLYSIQKDFCQAESTYLEALSILDTYYAPDFWFSATVLNNLGMIYVLLKKYSDAEPLLCRAHDINVIVNGLEHPNSAFSLLSLARLYVSQGKLRQAEPLFHEALDIIEKTLGATHSSAKNTIEYIVDLYSKTGELEKEEEFHARLSNFIK
ncbi:MAG: tetratricopeptide repeat protein [Candidatus Cloacimonadaceae bacterium]|nr:tetratricopeptide repeat protein [Candidatus Cloacimonadaceae bacterium]MDP3115264.1 tetratricopeptide repeat protein [Candidatus Cloacimonadaceae bacterium]